MVNCLMGYERIRLKFIWKFSYLGNNLSEILGNEGVFFFELFFKRGDFFFKKKIKNKKINKAVGIRFHELF